MRIKVLTRDFDLSALIEESLSGLGLVSLCEEYKPEADDVLICDADTCDVPSTWNGRLVVISKSRALPYENILPRPFLISDLLKQVGRKVQGGLRLDALALTAHLDGRAVLLTKREFALLSALASANGEFVTRETLLSSAFDGSDDAGLVSVYIHYLRNKLERGRRLIYSSRSRGYRLETERCDA